MNFSIFLFLILSPLCFFGSIIALISLIPYRKDSAVQALLVYFGLVLWLILTNLSELIAPKGPQTILFAKLQYLGFLFIPVAWIYFCLGFTGWLRKKERTFLLYSTIVPGILFLIVCTNEYHGLVWQDLHFIESGTLSVLQPTYGALFWVIALYIWGTIFAGTTIVFVSFLAGQKLYHWQSVWILIGVILPSIANLTHVFQLVPGLVKDYTSLAFAFSGFSFLLGIYYHRLFWIMPISRAAIVEELKLGIIVLDKNGYIIDHNKISSSLLDLDPVSIGKPTRNYPSLMEVLDLISSASADKTSRNLLLDFEWKGKIISIAQETIRHASQEGTLLILEDISEQRGVQKQVQDLKEEIIRQAQFVELGRISAGVAHEIRNPLGYMKSDFRSLQKLMERLKEFHPTIMSDTEWKEIEDIFIGVNEGVYRIEHTLNSLLSLTKREQTEELFVPYDLHEGIDKTLLLLQSEYRTIAEIRKEYGPIPSIQARKNELNQVLFNILINAIEAIKSQPYLGRRGGWISIKTWQVEESVYCEIANNGPPISEKEKELIFNPFFTTKHKEGKGFGIGLYLSKEIVETHHKGRLELASPDPVTFRIIIPVQPS